MFKPMFVPPRDNPLMVRLVNSVLPVAAHLLANIRDVEVPPEDFAHLRELHAHRALLSPNHPTGMDPVVLLWVSRMLGRSFNYLAAREALQGPKGWLLNQVGAYSVIRGIADRESLRTTRRLLAEQDRKVVIFPEGEVYEHNDRLLAFQSGVAQIGFWALDDLVKAGKTAALPILPVAIKYRCVDSPRPAIENGLRGLERALNLAPAANLGAYQRLCRIGDRVISTLERQVGLPVSEGGDLGPRIAAGRQRMLQRVAEAIHVEVNEEQSPADQIHLLFHELKEWVGTLPEDASDYDRRLYGHRVEVATPLFNDLQRLQSFIAVTGDYVAAEATAERFLDVMGRLEQEVFGEVRNRVPRQALVRIAPPIPLEERYDDYRKNKRAVVAAVTGDLETAIRGMLQELSRRSTPIALDA
ncbi:MAG TPA: 1-acyl-sn-glycerol-3-phosphate acyltransferase [Armatimonadota bacterium]|nr:1-acyl-sn-glycerol-3-phosphate acyltransferase [Armatimonadota bacterium]